jgi:maltoporin
MTIHRLLRYAAATAVALLALSTQAVEMNGYFRDTAGFNSKGGSMSCFKMPGTDFKSRLGNECERYLEMDFSQTGKVNDAEWRVEFMPASAQGFDSTGNGNNLFLQQMWLGLKVPDFGGATVWAGRRYWKRHDVHSIDWFYWNPAQGNPALGVEDISVGGGAKLALTVFTMANAGANTAAGNLTTGMYITPEIRAYSVPVNPDGTLEAGIDLALAHDQNKALGQNRADASPLFTLQHNQDKLFGGSNTLAFQYGSGAWYNPTGDGPGQLNGGNGFALASVGSTKDTQWRIIEHLVVNPTPELSGALVLVYQDLSAENSTGAKLFTAEVRPEYQFNDYFRLIGDAFYQTMTVKNAPSGFGTPTLFKLTVAPTLVLGRGYWARPQIRLFVTYASWNDATQQLGTLLGSPVANGAFGTSKSGTNIGVNVETWF